MASSDYEPFPLDPASVGCERLAERVRELEALVGRLAERNGQLSQLLTRYVNGEVTVTATVTVATGPDEDGEVD